MSTEAHVASLEGEGALELFRGVVDDRTLEILERRRTVGTLRRRGWLIRRALLAADLVGLSLAFGVATAVYGLGGAGSNRLGAVGETALFVLALPAWVIAAKVCGLYDRDEERTGHSTADDFSGVFQLVTVTSWLLFAAAHIMPFAHPGLAKFLVFWIVAITVLPLARAFGRARCRRSVHYLQNTVIMGAGDVGQALARKLLRHPEYGINLLGFVDAEPKEPADDMQHVALIGEPADLPQLVRLLDVERVIFAFSGDSHVNSLDLIRTLNELNVQVEVVPRFFEVIGGGVHVHSVEGLAVIGLPPFRLSRSSRLLKRALDVVGSTLGLLFLAPLFAVVALLIKLDSPGPVFFRQVRAGAGDELFRIWKFRTMTTDAEDLKDAVRHLSMHARPGGDARMFKVEEDPRATRVGRVLRRLSIDELPQLINVLLGEMSLVGPRPLILEEDRYVEDWARRRLNLKPGMTGLWQVLGRNHIPFDEMIRLDYLYVTSWSLGGDVRLILRTIPALFGATRAY
jgi:exopolysaccharide biosynthesis polyprenyl glycosylphosphotransferase